MADPPARERETTQAEKTGRGRRVLRWVVLLALSGLAALVILLACMPLITDTGLVRGLVCRLTAAVLRAPRVELETLRIAPLRRRVLLIEGFRLAPAEEPDAPAFQFARLECHWKATELRHRRLRLTSVRLEAPALDLHKIAGQWNVLRILPPSPKPFALSRLELPLPVQVDSFAVTDGTLEVSTSETVKFGMYGLAAEGTCQLRELLRGEARLALRSEHLRAATSSVALSCSDGTRVHVAGANPTGQAELTFSVALPSMQATTRLGRIQLPASGAAAEASLGLPAVSSVKLNLAGQVGGMASGLAACSATREGSWSISGTSSLAVDLIAVQDVLDTLHIGKVSESSLTGKAFVTMDFAGVAPSAPGFRAALSAVQRATLVGVGAEAEVETGVPLTAGVHSALTTVQQRAQIVSNGPFGGIYEVLATADDGSIGAQTGSAAFEFSKACGALRAAASLPDLRHFTALAAADGTWAASVPGASHSIRLPVRIAMDLSGTDLTSPLGATGRASLQGSMGRLVPYWGLFTEAGLPGLPFAHARLTAVFDADDVLQHARQVASPPAPMPVELDVSGPVFLDGRAGIRSYGDDPHMALNALLGGSVRCSATTHAGAKPDVGQATGALTLDLAAAPSPRRVCTTMRVTAQEGEVAFGAEPERLQPISLQAGIVEARAEMTLPDLPTIRGAARAACSDLTAHPGLHLSRLDASTRYALDALSGDVHLWQGIANCADTIKARLTELTIGGYGAEDVRIEAAVEVPDLGSVHELLRPLMPASMPVTLREAHGVAQASARLSGRAPLLERLLASAETRLAFALPPLFPLRAFYTDAVPLNLHGSLRAEEAGLRVGLPEDAEASVDGLSFSGNVVVDAGNLDAEGSLTVDEIAGSASPVPLRGMSIVGSAELTDFDAANAEGRLEALDGAVRGNAALSVRGLAGLRPPVRPSDLLRELNVDAEATGDILPAELPELERLAHGRLGVDASLMLTAGSALDLRLRPRLDGFSLSYADLFAMQGLNGSVAVNKSWAILEEASSRGPGLSAAMLQMPSDPPAPGFAEGLPRLSPAIGGLLSSADGISLGSLRLFGTEIARDGILQLLVDAPRVQASYHLRPLGGRMIGTAQVTSVAPGARLRARAEFADVDCRMLLPPELRPFRGDSRVNGTARGNFVIAPAESGAVLRDVEAAIDLTHIGPLALSRAILALDPEGERPSLVRLRRALSWGAPRGVRVRLNAGFVSASVELQGTAAGLLREYALPAFNVAGLLAAPAVTTALERARPMLQFFEVLGREHFVLAADGGVHVE